MARSDGPVNAFSVIPPAPANAAAAVAALNAGAAAIAGPVPIAAPTDGMAIAQAGPLSNAAVDAVNAYGPSIDLVAQGPAAVPAPAASVSLTMPGAVARAAAAVAPEAVPVIPAAPTAMVPLNTVNGGPTYAELQAQVQALQGEPVFLLQDCSRLT